jgi:glycine oxidase
MTTHQTSDVVIVGAGVIGCSIAYFLAQAGVQVRVVERATIAAEASSAAAGLLSPLGNFYEPGAFTDFAMASWSSYATLIPILEEASGVQVGYHRLGSLRVASTPESARKLRQRMDVWQALGWQVSWLTADEARQREPLLEEVEGAVFASQEGSIVAPNLTRAYALAAQRLGATFMEHAEVKALKREGERIMGIETAAGETIACQQVVLATGAWSAQWSDWLGFELPVRPVRGQILSLQQPSSPLRHIIFSDSVYLIPKPDETIYAGATIEQVGFQKQNTVRGVAQILTNTLRATPGLGDATLVKIWAGLRPGSPDGYPILGKAPGWENVVLATGHAGMGFELSSVTGRSIAELLTTGQTPPLIQPFGIERLQK